MNRCARLTDRMPLVALGGEQWTAAELHHLGSCPSCGEEWELVRLARRLGEGRLPRLDPQKVSQTLLHRLQHSHVRRRARRVWMLTGLGLAASLAAILWSGQSESPSPSPASLAGRLEIPLPELEGLEPGQLDSVLRSMDEPLAADSTADSPELGELEREELETVLDIWEG